MSAPEGTEAPRRGRPAPAGGSRSLAPREHGAYGQLGLPLVAALAMGSPSLASVLLASASVAAFVAHEPLLVVLGRRGPKALREDGARARHRLGLLGALALASAGVGAWLAPPLARMAMLVPATLALAVAALIRAGKEKTTPGECVAAAALAAAALPVAIAEGIRWNDAGAALFVWTLSFGAATFAVRGAIAHGRAPVPLVWRLLPDALICCGLAALFASGAAPRLYVVASLPMVVLAAVLAVATPHPRSLKKVGWALVASSVLTAALLVVAARV